MINPREQRIKPMYCLSQNPHDRFIAGRWQYKMWNRKGVTSSVLKRTKGTKLMRYVAGSGLPVDDAEVEPEKSAKTSPQHRMRTCRMLQKTALI